MHGHEVKKRSIFCAFGAHGKLLLVLFQVDQYLRVVGRQRVFAVGDATDVPETKLGYLAKAQVLTQHC